MESKEKKIEEKVKIGKLEIKIGDQKINLTVEDAKKLKDLLNGIFEKTEIIKEVVKEEHHYHDHYPYSYYPYIWWDTTPKPYFTPLNPSIIWCDAWNNANQKWDNQITTIAQVPMTDTTNNTMGVLTFTLT